MNEDFFNRINREFWTFLRSRGFAKMDDQSLMSEAEKIDASASGKRIKARRWKHVNGGEHKDDIALVRILAESLRLRERLDWDWALEYDKYHYYIAFSQSPRCRELMKLIDLYHMASLVRLQVYARFLAGKAAEEISDDELQRIFQEEWTRVREEKQRMHQETMRLLREAFEEAEKVG